MSLRDFIRPLAPHRPVRRGVALVTVVLLAAMTVAGGPAIPPRGSAAGGSPFTPGGDDDPVLELVTVAVLDVAPFWGVRAGDRVSSGAGASAGQAPAIAPTPEQKLAEARNLFDQAFGIVTNYAYRLAEPSRLAEGAIQGMLLALGDGYASYYPPDRYLDFLSEVEGEFGGIGARISVENAAIVIFNTLPGSPAERAGLLPGDMILSVDGTSTRGMALEAVADLIRGEPGTKVTLEINRAGIGVTLVEIVRELIRLVSVESEQLPDGVGYIRILSFDADTSEEFREHLVSLKEAGARGLVLDLRDNPGGLLGEVIQVAESFLMPGDVVLYVDRASRGLDSYRAYAELLDPMGSLPEPNHPQWTGPMVVLVNERSASGAELLAGALQDYGRGTLVGTRTYGKGSVQSIFDLVNEGGLKLTTAKDMTGKGRDFDGIGLTPDVLTDPEPPDAPDMQLILMPSKWVYRLGHAGSDIVLLQKRLHQMGYDPVAFDGDFGPKTEAALKAFQRAAGLEPTGVADLETQRAMNTAYLGDQPGGGTSGPGAGDGGGETDSTLARSLEVLHLLIEESQ